MYGLSLVQDYDNTLFNRSLLKNIVTDKRTTTIQNIEDMIIASVSLKYAQSNSIAFAHNGQLSVSALDNKIALIVFVSLDKRHFCGLCAMIIISMNVLKMKLLRLGKTNMSKQEEDYIYV